MDSIAIPFPPLIFPGNLSVCGPSISGKSTLVAAILRNKEQLISEPIHHMIFCHVENPEPQFESIPGLQFHRGLPDSDTLNRWLDLHTGQNLLIAFDDMQIDFLNSDISEALLGRLAHHRNIFTVCISQSIFPRAKHSRQASLQYHGIILTRSCRDTLSIQNLATQIFGSGSSKRFLAAFFDATELRQDKRPSYLFVQMHPLWTNRELRVFTNIFPVEAPLIGYKI